jgi:hypothetical protein
MLRAVRALLARNPDAGGLAGSGFSNPCLRALSTHDRKRLSTFFVRRMYHHNQQPMPWRHWLRWLVVVDLHRQLVLAQKAHAGPTNDGANLRPLVDTANTVSAIGLVLADAEFDSELTITI